MFISMVPGEHFQDPQHGQRQWGGGWGLRWASCGSRPTDWPKQLLSSALADPGLQGPLKTFWAAGRQRHQSVLDTAFLLSPPPSFLRSLGSPASLWPLLALILLEKGPSALLYERHLSLGPQGYTLLEGYPGLPWGTFWGSL